MPGLFATHLKVLSAVALLLASSLQLLPLLQLLKFLVNHQSEVDLANYLTLRLLQELTLPVHDRVSRPCLQHGLWSRC